MPAAEKCNAVDDDCNGMVDDGDNLCPAGEVCAQGTCVHPATTASSSVSSGSAATPTVCARMRAASADLRRRPGVCRGHCVGGCDGVVCPHGQVCRLGNCVSPCAGVTCPVDRVCEGGACQPPCGGCRSCAAGFMCNTTRASASRTAARTRPAPRVRCASRRATAWTAAKASPAPAARNARWGAARRSAPDGGVSTGAGGTGIIITGRGGSTGTGGGVAGSTGTAGTGMTGTGGTTSPPPQMSRNVQVRHGPRARHRPGSRCCWRVRNGGGRRRRVSAIRRR